MLAKFFHKSRELSSKITFFSLLRGAHPPQTPPIRASADGGADAPIYHTNFVSPPTFQNGMTPL